MLHPLLLAVRIPLVLFSSPLPRVSLPSFVRFGEETLRILESVLASKDVESLTETRSVLRELLWSEAKFVLREMAGKVTYQKLFVVEFLIQAFALVGDVEASS